VSFGISSQGCGCPATVRAYRCLPFDKAIVSTDPSDRHSRNPPHLRNNNSIRIPPHIDNPVEYFELPIGGTSPSSWRHSTISLLRGVACILQTQCMLVMERGMRREMTFFYPIWWDLILRLCDTMVRLLIFNSIEVAADNWKEWAIVSEISHSITH
jgi:hypothetical protein